MQLNSQHIPFVDLKWQYRQLKDEIDTAIARVIDNCSFILGPEVESFEKEFAEYIGVEYAVGTSSGTSALMTALMALGIREGDEVIVPAMTFQATAEAAALLNAHPVFVDIEPTSYGLDMNQVADSITERSKAIIPVHLYGCPVNMEELKNIAQSKDIHIIEDCAHSPGAKFNGRKTGSFADLGAFSFYPSKNLGSFGEAGIVTTDNTEFYQKCLNIRNHGAKDKFKHIYIGLNARMQGLQAAILKVKLKKLDEWNMLRRQAAAWYDVLLKDAPLSLPTNPKNTHHVYHIYPVLTENRNEIMKRMLQANIGVNLHYPSPVPLLKSFAKYGYKKGDFPIAEMVAEKELSLPCYPGMLYEQVRYVSEILLNNLREFP